MGQLSSASVEAPRAARPTIHDVRSHAEDCLQVARSLDNRLREMCAELYGQTPEPVSGSNGKEAEYSGAVPATSEALGDLTDVLRNLHGRMDRLEANLLGHNGQNADVAHA